MLAPVDLWDWVVEGQGNWQLESRATANDTVLQSENDDPGVFYDPRGGAQGRRLSGTITVEDGNDDDFVGFVLGYTPGAISGENSDFLLIDWKRADQDYGRLGFARAGLAISHVTGALREAPGPWAHDGADNVRELARAVTLGATGWQTGRDYAFEIVFTASEVRVSVNGQQELRITGTFPDSAFGFYNYSQPQVRYAGIRTARATRLPIWLWPLLAGLLFLAAVLAAWHHWRRRSGTSNK